MKQCMCLCWCVLCVHVCVCLSVPPSYKAIITSVEWYGPYMIGYFYMAAVVLISRGCGLRIEVHHRNQLIKNKLVLYKPLISLCSACMALEYELDSCVAKLASYILTIMVSLFDRVIYATYIATYQWFLVMWLLRPLFVGIMFFISLPHLF